MSQARASLPEIVQRVTDGEEVTITRNGRPVAIVVRPDTLRVRRGDAAFEGAAAIHDLLIAGRTVPLDAAPPLSDESAQAMIEDLGAGRSRR